MKSESWVSITGHVLYFQIFLPGGAANLEEQSKWWRSFHFLLASVGRDSHWVWRQLCGCALKQSRPQAAGSGGAQSLACSGCQAGGTLAQAQRWNNGGGSGPWTPVSLHRRCEASRLQGSLHMCKYDTDRKPSKERLPGRTRINYLASLNRHLFCEREGQPAGLQWR